MDVLCLKAHSPAYCWHVLTCFLSICGSFVCLSYHQLRRRGWRVICALWFHYQTDGKSLRWYSQCYVCARRREKERVRERHKDVTICLWNHDAQEVSCDGCFTVSLPWKGSLVSRECFSSDWLSGWSSSLMFFTSAFCLISYHCLSFLCQHKLELTSLEKKKWKRSINAFAEIIRLNKYQQDWG